MNNNEIQKLKHLCTKILIGLVLILTVFWILLNNQLNYTKSDNSIQGYLSTNTIGEVVKGTKVIQKVNVEADVITSMGMKFHTYGRVNNSQLRLSILDVNGRSVFTTNLESSKLVNDAYFRVVFDEPIKLINNQVQIVVDGMDGEPSPSIWIDNTRISDDSPLTINGQKIDGTLNIEFTAKDAFPFNPYFLGFSSVLLVLISFLLYKMIKDVERGKRNQIHVLIQLYERYQFLLSQLISRDFKTKYRRSALGVIWSFLNPLLTMLVQYVVFSSIFRSSIENFPVYLLSAIIVFNFFSEASNLSLTSVTSNASLITKVYIPKYVFPISRVFSSSINFGLSFIPLLMVMLFTGQSINFNVILILYSVFFTIVLFIGFGFILSTLLVFFRDMQFLWSVILLIWMYATPLFYPASIIPPRFRFILDLNPLYHIISFNRTILLQGVSPELSAYFLIASSSLIIFVIGAIIFKKSQDKFIFYL